VSLWVVALCANQRAGSLERRGADGGGYDARQRERALQPAPSLAEMPLQIPEEPEPAGQPLRRLGLTLLQGPVERRAQVVMLGRHPGQPGCRTALAHRRMPFRHHRQQVIPRLPPPGGFGHLAPPLYLVWPGEATGELNPVAADRQGGADYDGTALVGSGVLDEQSPRYRLTFPRPGHFFYVDLEYPGLVGEVIVLPAAGARLLP
jgi:hypothetical protein